MTIPPAQTTQAVRSVGVSAITMTRSAGGASGSGGGQTTIAPTLISNPFNNASDIIPTEEFAWEDWWEQNLGYLLAEYPATKEKDYATSLRPDDVPRLLVLLAYRGLFDKGIHQVAINGLRELGPGAVDMLIAIAKGDYKFPKEFTKASVLQQRDYAPLATMALGYLGGERAKEAVAQVLMKDMGYKSEHAAGSPADELLKKLVKDKSDDVKFWACLSLGRIGDQEFLPILKEVLATDKSRFVRGAAAEAIAMIGGAKSIPILNEAIETNKAYYQVKTFIAAALGFVGATDPIDDIKTAMNSSDGNVRVAGTWALASIISRRVHAHREYEELLDLFVLTLRKESDDDIRRSMALGFALMPCEEVLPAIKPFLVDARDAGVKAIAALTTGFIGSPECVKMLASLPNDTEPVVEAARAYGLLLLASSNKTKLAVDLMNTESEVLKSVGMMQASKDLGEELYRKISEDKRSSDEIVRRAVAYVMVVHQGDKGLAASRRFINGNSDAMKAIVFTALGILNNSSALEELTKYARIKDKEMKKSVDIGLALMGGLPLMKSMETAMKDGKPQVRSAAVVALGSLNRPEAIDAILEVIQKERDFKVVSYAISSLASVTIPEDQVDKVVKILSDLVKSKTAQAMIRANAAFMLSLFPQNRLAYETVQLALDSNDSDVQAMAAVSLGMFKNPSAGRSIKTLIAKKRGTPLAYAGYLAIGMIGDKTFISDLISDFEFANGPDEFLAMSFAIAKCADKETYVKLLPYLRNQDVYLKEFSVKCIGMMEGLTDEARKEIIEKLTDLEREKDAMIVFYSSLIRYNLGDRKALSVMLKAAHDNQFYLDKRTTVDWFALMELVNSTLPPYRKIKTYIWGDEE